MEKKKEELDAWIEKIKDSGKIIIVEGPKDRKALEYFGIKNIMTLKKPLYVVTEEIAEKYKEAIILTDFDTEGRKLYARLKKDLSRNGVKVDRYFREFLQRNTKLSHIEGLKTYAENHER